MFGLRSPRPPLTTGQRLNIELLLRKTVDTIGFPMVREARWLHSIDDLLLDCSSPTTTVHSAAERLVELLPPLPSLPRYEIKSEVPVGLLSHYDPPHDDRAAVITIGKDTADDRLRCLIELAYRLSDHYWHDDIDSSGRHLEARLTHLLPIVCGLGILASEASLYDTRWSVVGYSGWSLSRIGYYNAEEIGYALAVLSHLRCEDNRRLRREWLQQLRLDARATAQKALRFFEYSQQNARPLLIDAAKIPSGQRDQRELASWLTGDDSVFALAAAQSLAYHDELTPLAIDAAIKATRHGDDEVVAAATRLLGRQRQLSQEVKERITTLIRNRRIAISWAAVQAADDQQLPLHLHKDLLSRLLNLGVDDYSRLLTIVGKQGQSLSTLSTVLCQHLQVAQVDSDAQVVDEMLDCLQKINARPRDAIQLFVKQPPIRESLLARLAQRK